jgi:RNA polymerase sigma factor (sigma-70 family)
MEKTKNEKYNFQEFLKSIHLGDERAIEKLYSTYKSEFIVWATSKSGLLEEDLTDIWQESVIAFYEQVAAGKLVTLKVQLKTYLFAIGKNKILVKLRKNKSVERLEQLYLENPNIEDVEYNGYVELEDREENLQKKRMAQAMKKLSSKEQDILIDRYYSGLSLEVIRQKRAYKTINTVNATISRAMKNLKKIVHEKKNKLSILLSFLF